MTIIVSLMLLNEGMLQKLKLLHCQYITQNSESIIYISGPPSEEENPPSSGSAYGLVPVTYPRVYRKIFHFSRSIRSNTIYGMTDVPYIHIYI